MKEVIALFRHYLVVTAKRASDCQEENPVPFPTRPTLALAMRENPERKGVAGVIP